MVTLSRRLKNPQKPVKKSRQASRKMKREGFNIRMNKTVLLSVVMICVIGLLVTLLPKQNIMPIEKIRITGNFRYLETQKIEKHLQDYLGDGFFSVDIKSIQHQISQQPWIKKVSVRRVWPDLIAVHLLEKEAFARWDETHLLDRDAIIFTAESKKFQQLPLINGYSGNSRQLLQRFVELRQQFSNQKIELSGLIEDSKGALRLLLNNQLSVSLGSENNDQKIQHLLMVYQQQIQQRSQHIKHIDFRYSNGFAIAWKKEYLEKTGQLQRGSKNV
jgi:cell division protein FtsQ